MNEKRDVLLNFKSRLDSVVKYDTNNNPYWSARDLQEILGYNRWDKFNLVIQRAINSCINVSRASISVSFVIYSPLGINIVNQSL